MKSLLVSDIHNSYKALDSIFKLIRNKKISAIIFAGDLVDMGEPVGFVDEFLWLIESCNVKLLWVPGNNDFGRAYYKLNAKIKSLEGVVSQFGDRCFTGVGGSPASWAGQYQGERSVDKKAIAGSIFISHVPPPGISHYEKFDQPSVCLKEDNVGDVDSVDTTRSEATINNKTIKRSNNTKLSLSDAPLVHICGHIHHTWGIGYLGSTKVIKLAGAYMGYYAIMDLSNLHVKFERFWK